MPVPEHLHKARAFLQDAQLCVDHGRYDSAVSRAYYAMFRAAIALLEHYGDVRPGWNHRRLSSQESRTVLEAANRFVAKIEGGINHGTHP
jgi:hypothetical protein